MTLMDIKEVSAWLNLKPSTLYLWVSLKKIPALKIHGVIRFERDAIERWMRAFQTSEEAATSETVAASRPDAPRRRRRRHGTDNLDALIARAKANAYSSGLGDQTHATGRRKTHGSV
jgi:excisionase family DNA binding protein